MIEEQFCVGTVAANTYLSGTYKYPGQDSNL